MIFDASLVFIIALFAWFSGSIAAGGAGLIFIVLSSFFLPLSILPIILGFTGFIGGGYSVYLYRHNIYIPILKWLISGTICGAIIGAGIFVKLESADLADLLRVLMGTMLIIVGTLGITKYKTIKKKPPLFIFFIVGAVTAILSGIIGAGSPIVNKLFGKFALSPVEVVGTISYNNFALQGIKSLIYVFALFIWYRDNNTIGFDITTILYLTIFAICGSILGSILGKKALHIIDKNIFDLAINITLFMFGIKFLFS